MLIDYITCGWSRDHIHTKWCGGDSGWLVQKVLKSFAAIAVTSTGGQQESRARSSTITILVLFRPQMLPQYSSCSPSPRSHTTAGMESSMLVVSTSALALGTVAPLEISKHSYASCYSLGPWISDSLVVNMLEA